MGTRRWDTWRGEGSTPPREAKVGTFFFEDACMLVWLLVWSVSL